MQHFFPTGPGFIGTSDSTGRYHDVSGDVQAYGDLGKHGHNKVTQHATTDKRRLFTRFMRAYGTRDFPAWAQDRADCAQAWRRGNLHGSDEPLGKGCKKIIGQMRETEYVAWLKQQLRAHALPGPLAQTAKEILGRGGEHAPVHVAPGDTTEDGAQVGEDVQSPAHVPWGLIIGGTLLAGVIYTLVRRK